MTFKILRGVLKMALEAAKDMHPHEFVALLGGKGELINELVFLPFQSGSVSAIIHMDMLPIGMRVLGTIHSHPSPNATPSQEDLQMFARFGKVHIIVAYPYGEDDWKCYDRSGQPTEIEVVEGSSEERF
ncbi:Mov34/MPN/PAD-1 family protein [Archaeoglobus veneficus]|uniref:MPN domain-containing protein n=1 Tax=Archaeoglobus veneficus (strain DSM 11195 / SNP6) TaxID=693661 RepID=F2KSH0_ARCVS|nr:Mov34/MPN/PAD-1 family protein [Archaeoglobus veneficus]AEA46939.1 hypothetical protein Arcve_0928 [Archaeoglobus veneficus SNP6]